MSIPVESALNVDASTPVLDASLTDRLTGHQNPMGASFCVFECVASAVTEAPVDYSFHEFLIREPSHDNEDDTTFTYMEIHPCANSGENASLINDFNNGLSTCSDLEDIPEPEGDKDGDEGEHPIIDMAEFEELDEIPIAGKKPALEKTSTTPITCDGQLREAPSIFQASAAVEDLKKLLKPA